MAVRSTPSAAVCCSWRSYGDPGQTRPGPCRLVRRQLAGLRERQAATLGETRPSHFLGLGERPRPDIRSDVESDQISPSQLAFRRYAGLDVWVWSPVPSE